MKTSTYRRSGTGVVNFTILTFKPSITNMCLKEKDVTFKSSNAYRCDRSAEPGLLVNRKRPRVFL